MQASNRQKETMHHHTGQKNNSQSCSPQTGPKDDNTPLCMLETGQKEIMHRYSGQKEIMHHYSDQKEIVHHDAVPKPGKKIAFGPFRLKTGHIEITQWCAGSKPVKQLDLMSFSVSNRPWASR
jgi:hypothetical protein